MTVYTVTAITTCAITGSDSGGVCVNLSQVDGGGALAFVLGGAEAQAWLTRYPVGATLNIPEDAPLFTLIESGLIRRLSDSADEGDPHA